MEKKNQVLMTVLGVFALVIVTVGVSYAFFTYSRTSTNTGTITAGSLNFGFTEDSNQNIQLENAEPIENTLAEAAVDSTANVAVYKFNVTYNASGDATTKYTVELVKQTEENELDEKFVKVALFDGESNLGTKALADAIATPYIKNETITTGTTKNYTLKMWMDKAVAGFEANDNGTGTLTPSEGDNYTTSDNGQTANAAWAGKKISVKVKVSAVGTTEK